jgi:DNA polymerase III delta subunit
VSSHIHSGGIDLLVVDEVDRLLPGCLEVLRDFYARYHLGLMLLVRPGGLSRLLSLEPLASRVGIFHLFQALGQDATRQVLEQQAQQWGVKVEEKGAKVFVDRTQGNFTMISHLLMHLSYLVEHRGIQALTKEAIDIAASMVMSRQNLQQMREYFRGTEPL